ncbi:PIG-L deacetylase family protein [Thermogemmatispora sp.]|uniref:PIG-L deacetylase family protein n=1 Tax=Thermogemmatispora sp. TaxID=1968838 RepID=UPI0035E4450C
MQGQEATVVTAREQARRAMVIVAHPDDAEFGCAGSVARWVREGWEVYYVICTDGGGGGPDEALDVSVEARQRTIETRKAEQRAACQVLGVKEVIFLDYPDGQLQPTRELKRELVRLLRLYRPTRVVCQSPERSWTPVLMLGRYHPDHLTAGRMALEAIYPASQNAWDFPELLTEGLRPHRVREIYIMGAPVPNHAEDISETIELKLQALQAHASQVGDHFEQVVERVRRGAQECGARHQLAYAEEFHRTENGR